MLYAEKGVPNFWLTAMKNNEVLSDEVSYPVSCFVDKFFLLGIMMLIFTCFEFGIRLLSVMKELSNISRILSGIGLRNPKDSSLSFTLTPILISKILC